MAVQRADPGGHADHALGGFARGKGKFVLTEYVPTDERTGSRFPLLLTTGRILSQYNVGAQTRRTANVVWHEEDRLEIHPHDAEQRGIKDGDWVRLASRAGETALRALITDRVAPGVVYTTFHHPTTQANVITTDFSDWATNCPEYKVTAVQVRRSNGPTHYQEDYEQQTRAEPQNCPGHGSGGVVRATAAASHPAHKMGGRRSFVGRTRHPGGSGGRLYVQRRHLRRHDGEPVRPGRFRPRF